MRALLVVNPRATATSSRAREVLISALGSELKVDVAQTRHRGHATALAAQAARDGCDAVVALGGDGTVNEVVNGLLRVAVPATAMLGVVPTGDANVFARGLGIPAEPIDATSVLLDCLRERSTRLLGLGRADGRHFTFTAGLGIDAMAVHRVERARRQGRRSTAPRYLRAAVRSYLASNHRRPVLELDLPEERAGRPAFLAVVSNTAPWTYVGRRPVWLSPRASYESGLDLLALSSFGPIAVARTATGMLAGESGPRGPAVVSRHDLASLVVRARHPVDFQLDGEYLGERSEVNFVAVPRAVRVLAPPSGETRV